jgi:hypothetical protein
MTDPRQRALDFLGSRGADTISHLNGTLLDHLLATESILRGWGSGETLCLAGLCHAAYGTDGFAPHLVSWHDRHVLAAATGLEVEETVYLYASCDRSLVYRQLPGDGPVSFRDRFLGRTNLSSEAELRDFVDLTLANELEIAVSASSGSEAPPWFIALMDQIETRASPAARHGVRARLGLPV